MSERGVPDRKGNRIMERGPNFRQPNGLEDWRENDEPTSDLYRLTKFREARSFGIRRSIEDRLISDGMGRHRKITKPNDAGAGL